MEKYIKLNKQEFIEADYKLVPLRYKDRYKIMEWRNEQIYHLRQTKKLTKIEQDNYFDKHVKSFYASENPSNILFSFLHKNILIGYGGLVHIDWQNMKTEISFLLNTKIKQDKIKYSTCFRIFLNLIKEVSFEELKLNRIFSETYSVRTNQIKELEKNGFIFEGTHRESLRVDSDTFYDSIFHSILKKDS